LLKFVRDISTTMTLSFLACIAFCPGFQYKQLGKFRDLRAVSGSERAFSAIRMQRDTGNVWTNPQLTCQHVDPQVPLPHGAHAQYEMKILIFKGTLQDALRKVSTQVKELK
jgi:hypothetical protein